MDMFAKFFDIFGTFIAQFITQFIAQFITKTFLQTFWVFPNFLGFPNFLVFSEHFGFFRTLMHNLLHNLLHKYFLRTFWVFSFGKNLKSSVIAHNEKDHVWIDGEFHILVEMAVFAG